MIIYHERFECDTKTLVMFHEAYQRHKECFSDKYQKEVGWLRQAALTTCLLTQIQNALPRGGWVWAASIRASSLPPAYTKALQNSAVHALIWKGQPQTLVISS